MYGINRVTKYGSRLNSQGLGESLRAYRASRLHRPLKRSWIHFIVLPHPLRRGCPAPHSPTPSPTATSPVTGPTGVNKTWLGQSRIWIPISPQNRSGWVYAIVSRTVQLPSHFLSLGCPFSLSFPSHQKKHIQTDFALPPPGTRDLSALSPKGKRKETRSNLLSS